MVQELKSRPEIAVVIVNRNTKQLLKNCLESLPLGFSDIPYEVWVVDNGSGDGSADMVGLDYPQTHLIRNRANLGFAKANNQVLRQIEQPFALLLNSDTVLTRDCITKLHRFLIDHPEAAIAGPKLVNQEGKLQPSTYPIPGFWKDFLVKLKIHKLLPRKTQAGMLLGSFWNHSKARPVGRITGACILIRMNIFKSAGLLDENFFFYGEIHDLCWTLRERGKQVWFIPGSKVIHLHGQTSKKEWNIKEQRRRMWRENEKLLRKHRSSFAVRTSILLNWFEFLLANLKYSLICSASNAKIDKDLLEIDFDWHSKRIEEWFWFRFKFLYNFYFEKFPYSRRFTKRLIQKLHLVDLPVSELSVEVEKIQEELAERWNEAHSFGHRTGFMDFACAAFLYRIVRSMRPRIMVETGVANGISSTFILSAMEANAIGTLYSLDWPEHSKSSFVPQGKEIGWLVPDRLRQRWNLGIGRTEEKLKPLLDELGTIDIFLHDSDHSYETMMYEYKIAWPHIMKNGFLLSDDARMNTAFDEFTQDTGSPAIIYKGRLGICRKTSPHFGWVPRTRCFRLIPSHSDFSVPQEKRAPQDGATTNQTGDTSHLRSPSFRKTDSCRLCGCADIVLAKKSNIAGPLRSDSFAITNKNYGVTGTLYRCRRCGFLQCVDLFDVGRYYEDLEDPDYEISGKTRAIQGRRLLRLAARYRPSGRLLDIGAGSGILVEEALKMRYDASGVEPSRRLQARAEEHGLPVHLGIFPHPLATGPFDIVTLIDVLEHVSNPMALLRDIRKVLAPDGLLLVVTPDASSFIARFLGWKWWHMRVAHIGYFNKTNFQMALRLAGYNLIRLCRPGWYFTADYLFERAKTYLPVARRIPTPDWLMRITIPLNLRDSLLGICTRGQEEIAQ